MTDCVAFGIILDEAKEEHVLCIKKDDSNGPALSITTINTKLSKMLRCRLNLTDQPDGLATAIRFFSLMLLLSCFIGWRVILLSKYVTRCSLDEGKIQLDPLLQEICIQLPNHKLTEKMDVLSGSSQSEEIGTLLHSMIQRINKLEVELQRTF